MRTTKKAFFATVLLAAVAFPALEALAQVTRGPYLQTGTPAEVTVHWRTATINVGRVRYGPAPGSLASSVDEGGASVNHAVRLTGLAANTTYFYSVGSGSTVYTGGDATHYFVTSPASGASKPTRVWVLGDAGTAGVSGWNSNQAAVRDAYYAFTNEVHTDLWLMLGDNAYMTGTDAEYQNAVFNMYPDMLRKSVLWSTRGNHELDGGGTGSTYYAIFNLPTAAQAGGTASGTEAYYSFDYGNIHFICLDSQGTSRSATGPMATWLAQDLAATSRDWIVAFWHHPPYTKGSHDSDTGGPLIEMRENMLPILEAGGVDLVLAGHSHAYERSFLIDGHYGHSTTFNDTMKKDGGSGRETDTGAYRKPNGTPGNEGAVYVVAGSSGQAFTGLALNHPAMYVSFSNLGSVVLDVDGNRMDFTFLRETGAIGDNFTLLKGLPRRLSWSVAGAGTVARSPLGTDGLSPSANGAADYNNGTEVTLSALPASGGTFSGWSGPVADPDAASTTILMNQERQVVATFSGVTPPPAPPPADSSSSSSSGGRCGSIALDLMLPLGLLWLARRRRRSM